MQFKLLSKLDQVIGCEEVERKEKSGMSLDFCIIDRQQLMLLAECRRQEEKGSFVFQSRDCEKDMSRLHVFHAE